MASWFTDLAEKAESLLVAVDQTAAGALQTTPIKKRFEEPVLPVVIPSSQKPLHLPSSLSVQKPPPAVRPKRPSNIIADDQLLSYLNSPSESKSDETKKLENQLQDLRTTLAAKDSQLAVLRVRLQEADQEISAKKSLIDELTTENESLMKDHNSGSTNVTLQSLREQLRETDAELKAKQETFRTAQSELQAKISSLEADNKRLSHELSTLCQQTAKDKLQRRELEGQLQLASSSLEAASSELQDYKQRAQMILQSKDKLISSLRDGGGGPREAEQELEATRSELELARQEGETLRQALAQLEAAREAERQMWYDQRNQLESRLQDDQQARLRSELELQQAQKDLELARERLSEVRVELESRLQSKSREVERLTAKVAARPRPAQHPAPLELKVQQLTESLIKKQTVVETLASDKSSLLLQVERLEQQLAESLRYQESLLREPRKPRYHNFRPSPPRLYPDSPYDSLPTRLYKTSCRSLDSLNFQLGLFYTKYPLSRAILFLYLVFLQIWAVVLMYHYQPSSNVQK